MTSRPTVIHLYNHITSDTSVGLTGAQIGDYNQMYVNGTQAPAAAANVARTSSTSAAPAARQKIKRKIIVADEVVNIPILQLVSYDIGKDWTTLGRQLRLTDSDLDAVRVDNHVLGVRQIAYEMLRDWREQSGNDATLEVLAKALVAIKRVDIARKLGRTMPPV